MPPSALRAATPQGSYDQEPGVEVQVSDMAHLLGVASLVLGDVSDPDL